MVNFQKIPLIHPLLGLKTSEILDFPILDRFPESSLGLEEAWNPPEEESSLLSRITYPFTQAPSMIANAARAIPAAITSSALKTAASLAVRSIAKPIATLAWEYATPKNVLACVGVLSLLDKVRSFGKKGNGQSTVQTANIQPNITLNVSIAPPKDAPPKIVEMAKIPVEKEGEKTVQINF